MKLKELKIPGIEEGTVIDHIPSDKTFKAVEILNLADSKDIVSVATNLKSQKLGNKGIIKIGRRSLSNEEVNKIALIAPEATVNIIKNYEVIKKIKLSIPDELTGIIKCQNPKCITNKEPINTRFKTLKGKALKLMCEYCERAILLKDVELL